MRWSISRATRLWQASKVRTGGKARSPCSIGVWWRHLVVQTKQPWNLAFVVHAEFLVGAAHIVTHGGRRNRHALRDFLVREAVAIQPDREQFPRTQTIERRARPRF